MSGRPDHPAYSRSCYHLKRGRNRLEVGLSFQAVCQLAKWRDVGGIRTPGLRGFPPALYLLSYNVHPLLKGVASVGAGVSALPA